MAEPAEITVLPLGSPLDPAAIDDLQTLLCTGRPEFAIPWGEDHRQRLADNTGVLTAVALAGGAMLSHACVFFDKQRSEVGLEAHVYTHPDHRRQGLSAKVCAALLEAWDAFTAGGSRLVLGTGAALAAKLYGRLGFRPLLGSLDAHAFL